ncbi:hypothetical protein OfM1_02440 [Lactovum odontotermitis]
MTKYYLKNTGNYGFTGAYNINAEDKGMKAVYLEELFTELKDSDGENQEIYLSKFMKPYEKTIKDKYPKAHVEVADQFDENTKLHDWFPGTQPFRDVLKKEKNKR